MVKALKQVTKGVCIQTRQFIYVKVEVPSSINLAMSVIYLSKTNKFIHKGKEGYLLLPVD